MTQFLELPVEILPAIVENLLKPQHLTSVCLVNKTFYKFGITILYARASIYSWQREAKTKVIQLFTTLAQCPQLAKYVHRLEIRDFPKAFVASRLDVLDTVLLGITNCVNLRSCIWTRDGSLNSAILEALQTCNLLRELEVNGHDNGNYNPQILLRFNSLKKVSLIMPSAVVVNMLGSWFRITGDSLQSLTLLCRASPIITDTVLESLAPNLANLKELYITGCSKVTHRGVEAILSNNVAGIVNLGIEGVSTKFDMEKFGRGCATSHALDGLKSITLTLHQQLPVDVWMADVLSLLDLMPLEKFQIYSSGPFFESRSTDRFWFQLAQTHGSRLKRFSVHRMLISLDAIEAICAGCTSLEQLFVVVEPDALQGLGKCLSMAGNLRSVHVNYPLEAGPDTVPVLSASEALSTVGQCSSSLTQFGCNARVWQVSRAIEIDQNGVLHARPKLSPYESPDVPEPFLVVRT